MSLSKVILLGTGSSAGVPLIGCECHVCKSESSYNKRGRASIFVEGVNGTSVLIDTSPDLRLQAVAARLKHLDAILFTHAHADHIHGVDDVRSFNYHKNGAIAAYGTKETFEELQERFGYVFKPPRPEVGWYRPCLEPNLFRFHETFKINELEVTAFPQLHGPGGISAGFRIGEFVYSTDVVDFPEESEKYLKNIDLWVVDCLQYEAAPSHAHLEKTLSWVERFKPKRTVLTHMSHTLDYHILKDQLPADVQPGYDNCILAINP